MPDNSILVQINGNCENFNAAISKAEAHILHFEKNITHVRNITENHFTQISSFVTAVGISFQTLRSVIADFVIAPLAGEVGVHPGEFSLRQLFQMAEGKRRQEWYRAAVLACTISNPWRDPAHSLKMEHFPYCQELKPKVRMTTSAEIAAFAKAWNRGR